MGAGTPSTRSSAVVSTYHVGSRVIHGRIGIMNVRTVNITMAVTRMVFNCIAVITTRISQLKKIKIIATANFPITADLGQTGKRVMVILDFAAPRLSIHGIVSTLRQKSGYNNGVYNKQVTFQYHGSTSNSFQSCDY